MSYTIRLLEGEPSFDSLEVIKLRCTTDIPINDRIFAQAQLGRTREAFFARIWSFEPTPAPGAKLILTLSYGGRTLTVTVDANQKAALLANGEDRSDVLAAYAVSGEDLQGEYWGAGFVIPAEAFVSALGLDAIDSPAVLRGNILREHPGRSAAFADADEGEFYLN